MEGLAIAAGHADRHAPLNNYCKGLLLPGERKSIEPMAARLEPHKVEQMRQSLHHFVAKAAWSDEALLEQVRDRVMPAMEKNGPVVAWIVDDTGFPKKGRHSVGVTRQYCGASRQAGELPCGREPLGCCRSRENVEIWTSADNGLGDSPELEVEIVEVSVRQWLLLKFGNDGQKV